jgi:hypothetical protein
MKPVDEARVCSGIRARMLDAGTRVEVSGARGRLIARLALYPVEHRVDLLGLLARPGAARGMRHAAQDRRQVVKRCRR